MWIAAAAWLLGALALTLAGEFALAGANVAFAAVAALAASGAAERTAASGWIAYSLLAVGVLVSFYASLA
jgi:hypothetical protein